MAASSPGEFIVPFGKFKGTKLRDVEDLTYLDWMLSLENLREGTRAAIMTWLKLPANARDLELQLERKQRSR